jgi:hypothetical protein
MDHSKQIGEFANDVSNNHTDEHADAGIAANDIRALDNLEMMLAGGGDGVVIW